MKTKVTLISMAMLVNSYNVRLISGALREHGYATTKILLPDIYPYSSMPAYNFAHLYEDSIINDIIALARDSLWIGISVNTNLFFRAVDLTKKLKKRLKIPIVWGGVHVSAMPEECLEYADYIVLGEGEDTAVELTTALKSGNDPAEVPGVGVMRDGKMVFTYRRMEQKTPLAQLSWPDYSLEDEWIQDKEARRIRKFDLRLFSQYGALGPSCWVRPGPMYFTGASRGCPHRCSYCVHSLLARKFPEFMNLRVRPVDDFIAELLFAKQNLPTITGVITTDEDFLALGDDWIGEFCRQYPAKVGLPIRLMGSMDNITEERIKHLVEAGMIYLQVGIQGVSRRTSTVYNRDWAGSEMLTQQVRLLHKFRSKLRVQYDVMVDNPEETWEEQRATLLLITRIPKPFKVQPFTLTYFPGSLLFEQAKKKGIIKDDRKQIYLKSHIHPRATYTAFLYVLVWYNLPQLIVRLLASAMLFRLFHGEGFVRLADGIREAWRKLTGADSQRAFEVGVCDPMRKMGS